MSEGERNQSEEGSNEEDEDEYDENGKKIIKLREMTVFEKEAFAKARKKQKENIIKPQVVQGKTFKGQAFISKPDKIVFKDFSVGQTMVQTIYMTNVSFTFNSFKLLQLKESIKDFFDILYQPSGRISAGMQVPIQIRFTPQINEDIDEQFSVLAETGRIDIPLVCTCKKTIVKIEQTVVDFDKVIYGESCTKLLKLNNLGALETQIRMKSKTGDDLNKGGVDATSTYSSKIEDSQLGVEEQSQKDSQQNRSILTYEKCLDQLKFDKQFLIKGYSSLNIPFTYIPKEIGQFEIEFMVYFENFLYSPPLIITLRGECVKVPIYVEKEVYDFEICLLNHIYREKLVFYNRSQNAMKIQIIPPKETKNFFEFNPMLGYIQGQQKFEIWAKMNTDKELLNMCGKYIMGDMLEIPFKLIGADQVMPVPFTIKARLTLDTLQINPNKLDFGKFFKGSASRISLTFDNLSLLPQEVLFYPLPKEMTVEPDLIPLKILPKTKMDINLVYRGSEVKREESYLNCKIITGSISTKDIRIPFSCNVNKCPLSFSTLKVDMPVLQINEKHNTNIEITNTAQKSIIFEFFLPDFEICGLKMTPMVSMLEPGKKLEIFLEYYSFFKKLGAFTLQELRDKRDKDPNRNFALRQQMKQEEAKKQEESANLATQEDQDKKKKQPEKKAPEKLSKQQQKEQEEEMSRQAEIERQLREEQEKKRQDIEKNFDMKSNLLKLGGKFFEFNQGLPKYSQHYIWLVPCYFKYDQAADSTRQIIFLEITTVSVEKSLVVSQTTIDFGEIAVGVRTIQNLLLKNTGDQPANLKMDLLPLLGGFNVINALRLVPPGKTKNLVIQFEPHQEQTFKQTLKLFCDTSSVSVKLRGKGVKPEVKLIPEEGLLNVGSVLQGEKAEKKFTIKNISNFKIHFKLITKLQGMGNLNGSKPFSFIPSEASIESNQEIEIKVIFQPDKISEKFYELILIDVPNQHNEKMLFLYGQCFPRQAYVCYYQPYLKLPKIEDMPTKVEFTFDMLKSKDVETIFSANNNRILLQFEKPQKEKTVVKKEIANETQEQVAVAAAVDKNKVDETMQFSRKILLGNCRLLDPKNEKNSNFEIIMPKDNKYFSCDNMKGSVNGGQEIIVNFKFAPPKFDAFIENIEALQEIGQWIEQKAELKLSGGFIKPGQNDLWSFDIILRAYINQI